jgi:ASC-1-like (ASCH) protein
MITITREQAICMLYCVAFNDENVKKFVPTIDALKSLEICYKEDPMEPMLISLKSLEAHTVKYRKYPTIQSLEEK